MLCKTFKDLSHDTWKKIEQSKDVSFQLKEESITDHNLLHLKIKHPNEIHIHIFNKVAEGTNGADWEWWLNDNTDWLGFRVQAKIINNISDRFEHLHYQKKSSAPQSEILITQASPKGEVPRVPIYCLYLSSENLDSKKLKTNVELYGCSLLSAYKVAELRPRTDSIKALEAFLIPWHKLVCKKSLTDFQEHIQTFFTDYLKQEILDLGSYITTNPPDYIRAISQNMSPSFEGNYGKSDLAGVVVINLSEKK